MELEITSLHQEQYERDGFAIVRGGFTADECDRFVAYMMDLHAGRSASRAILRASRTIGAA